jgi:lipopolysaccharide export system permease protein
LLDRYILRAVAITFLVTLLVLTFVMSIGVILRVSGLLARGAPTDILVRLFLAGLPASLTFTIPISTLVSSLLVFGRLSADGEVTAMRTVGVSLYRILLTPLLFGLALSILCLYISNETVPLSHFEQRRAIRKLVANSSLQIIEEGRFIQQFPGISLYIGRKHGTRLSAIRVYDFRDPGRIRTVDAESGTIRVDTNNLDVIIELHQVRVDPVLDDRPGPGFMETWPLRIAGALRSATTEATEGDMTFGELQERIRDTERFFPRLNPNDLAAQRMVYRFEVHRRLVLSLACLVFVALGAPLGIKTHRKESSIGVAMSLGIVFVFYVFQVAGASLVRIPQAQPHLVAWIPVLLALLLAGRLVRRAN